MRNSLKQRILRYLKRNGDYVNGGDIERIAMENNFKGSTASRICRSLAEEGLILREERKGKRARSVWYRAIVTPKKFIKTEFGEVIEI